MGILKKFSCLMIWFLISSFVFGSLMSEVYASNTYKITTEDLFFKYPTYLTNAPTNNLEKLIFDNVSKVDDGISKNDQNLAAFVENLQSGSAMAIKEIGALLGFGENQYIQKRDAAVEQLLVNFCHKEDNIINSIADLKPKFENISMIYDSSKTKTRFDIMNILKANNVYIDDNKITEIVDSMYDCDDLMKYIGKGIDAADLIVTLYQCEEVELSVLHSLSNHVDQNSELGESLSKLYNKINSNIFERIKNNFINDKSMEYIIKATKKLIELASGTNPMAATVEIASLFWKVSTKILYHGVTVDDMLDLSLYRMCSISLDSALNKLRIKFKNGGGKESDITDYKVIYDVYISSLKEVLDAASKVTNDKVLKQSCQHWSNYLKETYSYNKYEDICIQLINNDIDKGILKVPNNTNNHKPTVNENYIESIKSRFQAIQRQYPPNQNIVWGGNYRGATQCFGFAGMIFNKLFEQDMPNRIANPRYKLVENGNVQLIGQISGNEVTTDNVRSLFAQAKLGDIIQMNGSTYGQHTAMFVSQDSSGGATVYDCNHNGDCKIYQWTMSASYFVNNYGGSNNSGISLYRSTNYSEIYGDGDGLFYDDSVNFVIENGVLKKYNGWQANVIVPDEVTEIGDSAFKGNKHIFTVYLPDGVTKIGDSAFKDCSNLYYINLPEKLEHIGKSAFSNCSSLSVADMYDNVQYVGNSAYSGCESLTSLNLSSKLTEINEYTFKNCNSLLSIDIPQNITFVDNGAFCSCNSLVSINMGDKVTSLGKGNVTSGSFQDCINLKDVKLSSTLEYIGEDCFNGCIALEKIKIPKTVNSTGYYGGAFGNCPNLKNVEFEDGMTKIANGLFSHCNGIEELYFPDSITEIGSGTFADCSSLRKVHFTDNIIYLGRGDTITGSFADCPNLEDMTLPSKLIHLGEDCFNGCTNLTEITVPKTVESTGFYGSAFANCTNLKKVIFENGMTKVPEKILSNCDSVEEIVLPKSITFIDNAAFSNCINLKKINLHDNITKLGSGYYCTGVFNNCDGLVDVILPKHLTFLGEGTFSNCDKIENITIPKTVKETGYYAGVFSNCESLQMITIEEGMEIIPEKLFQNSNTVKKVVLPKSIKTIENNAFSNCVSLSTINLPDSLIEIGGSAFADTALSSIEIPDSVTSMGNSIFSGCENLKKVKLPSSRVNIGSSMFADCTSLESIELPNTVESINYRAFANTGLKNISLSNNIKQIESNAFQNCDNLESISIPDSVKNIGSYAFQDCDLLKNVTLGNGITGILDFTFEHCDALQKITIPYRVNTIGKNAFANCIALTEITIPRAVTSIDSTAFSYPATMTIKGVNGTYAQTFANDQGIKFIANDVKATSVSLNKTSLSLNKGDKVQLTMNVKPLNFTDEVIWKSTNSDIISVDDSGLVSAKNTGTATIKVTVGNVSANCKITVVQPVLSIYLYDNHLNLDALESYQLTKEVYPANANNQSVLWTSSNPDVATVTQTGKVTAMKKGTTKITVSTTDGSNVSNYCMVTVRNTGYIVNNFNQMESSHNYKDDCTDFWQYTLKEANYLNVTFDQNTYFEDGFDYLYIYDKNLNEVGRFTGNGLSGKTITIQGDTVRIKLNSDDSGNEWGFKVTDVSTSAIHTHKYVSTIIKPTCTEKGYTKYTCNCGYGYISNYVNPIGHSYIASEKVLKATTNTDGHIVTTYTCKNCKHSYTNKTKTLYKISRVSLSKSSYTYNNKVQKPKVVVKDSKGAILKNNIDYTIKYPKGLKVVNKYEIIITFKGNYTGIKKISYNIIPKGTIFTKLTTKSKGFVVKWKKQSTQTTGYQIEYASNSKFTKNKKSIIVNKNKITSKTFLKLKAKKKYFVRIRTYKSVKIKGKVIKIYSSWSKVKGVTTK